MQKKMFPYRLNLKSKKKKYPKVIQGWNGVHDISLLILITLKKKKKKGDRGLQFFFNTKGCIFYN